MADANPERGEVNFSVNGHSYVLRSTTNMIRAMERRTNQTYGRILQQINDMGHEELCQMLFGLLQAYHAKEFKTLDQVGDLIDAAGGFTEVQAPIIEVLVLNKPRLKAAVDAQMNGNPQTSQDSTGVNSGSMPANAG